MKYLRKFNESFQYETDPERISEIILRIAPPMFPMNEGILNMITIQPNGEVDVHTDIVIAVGDLTRIPLKFGEVDNRFMIPGEYSRGLTTLEGSPRKCEIFTAYTIPLTSLQGAPQIVDYSFSIERCPLESLVGGPQNFMHHYYCVNTALTDLVGAPEKVGRLTVESKFLTSLEGCPKWADILDFGNNNYSMGLWDPTPLIGGKYGHIKVGKDTPLGQLKNLFNRYYPEERGLNSSQKKEITEMFIDSLDYNYIRGTRENPMINLFRLKEALAEFGIDRPKNLTPDGILNHYSYVDNDGRVVDFSGRVINI